MKEAKCKDGKFIQPLKLKKGAKLISGDRDQNSDLLSFREDNVESDGT